jgi:hypothetical protein
LFIFFVASSELEDVYEEDSDNHEEGEADSQRFIEDFDKNVFCRQFSKTFSWLHFLLSFLIRSSDTREYVEVEVSKKTD